MTTKTSEQNQAIETRVEFFPSLDDGLRRVEAPVREVTVLEDRAQVHRVARVKLEPGRNRLLIRNVAPVLQDVSLRGELTLDKDNAAGSATLSDLRARRAVRVRAADKPELARAVEEEIEKLQLRFAEVAEDRQRAEERYRAILSILAKGVTEIPEDASWGLVNHQLWHDTFEALYKRSRTLAETSIEHYFTQLEISEEMNRLSAKRHAFDRWDTDFVAWIEVDLEADRSCQVELKVEYVVPNAIWRPLHAARMTPDGKLRFRCSAAVWQNTGEDWRDAQLIFSTARASLGTEPPLLADDFLQAQRKSDRVVVEQRQVAVQKAGPGEKGGGGEPPRRAVDLPGVDDGGDVQNLRSSGPSDVPSDGRLNVIQLFEFESEADCQLVTLPELEQKAFLRATVANEAGHPILAGPVELIRESGVVGWTKVMFVAPKERFELSFGHDDGLRIYRTVETRTEQDEVDRWTHNDAYVALFLSNLEGSEKALEVRERIPVSEIEHVRVNLIEEWCKPGKPEVDENGFCSYRVTLPPNGRTTLQLGWRVSTAPDVEGI
jgi:uncharacterized protein (TIGR02231 family)